ncbi:MAG: LacI family DNA-binding transcriptional regulator [Arthrobacter sp.]|nr:LacI family DNA-binding transcriptional regulator [Arthrobacter sp.]
MIPNVVEVAKAAGVSRSTASRALSGHPHVNPKTRTKVLEAAAAMGYRVNLMATALRGGHSRLIGLVITNLVNASLQTITQVIQAEAQKHGYQVLLGVTEGDAQNEARIVETLVDHRVDGLILMGSDANTERTNGYVRGGLPVVNLIRRPAGSLAPSVLPDNYESTYQATRYLVSLGHRDIAYIGGPMEVASGNERYSGFAAALAESGVAVHQELVLRGAFDPEFGSQAMAQLLGKRTAYTALLVANHEAIFGVLPQLVDAGINLPQELSLVGIEDVPWFTAWRPPITVVDISPAAVAIAAFDTLLHQIQKESPENAPILRPGVKLEVRGSCAPVQNVELHQGSKAMIQQA